MPIYAYQCVACGEHFEVLTSRSKRQKHPACEKCGGRHTECVMSSFFGRSRTRSGSKPTGGSACSSCSATSCAACKR